MPRRTFPLGSWRVEQVEAPLGTYRSDARGLTMRGGPGPGPEASLTKQTDRHHETSKAEAAHCRRLPSEWGKAETGPAPDPSPSPGGAGRGPTGLGPMAPAASPRVREGPRLFVSHPTPQVPPGPFCRPRRRGAPDTLSQRPVGVRPGSSAPAHDRRARHCLTPRGGRGSAHSHFRGEFRPGPRPSLASVHTASLAPHGL